MSSQDKCHRRSIRLSNYNYAAQGMYFVTICTHDRQKLFGDIADGVMRINDIGGIVCQEWLRSEHIRCEIQMDEWIVMPNHMHGIVIINNNTVGAAGRSPLRPHGPAKHSLGSLIAGFKSVATKRINELRGLPGIPVWQRNYYERIIRNGSDLNRIRQYIRDNPRNWENDELNINH